MMTAQGIGDLPLHQSLSVQAKTAQILPALQSSLLVALGPLCDDGCIVVLIEKIVAIKENKVVLRGNQN